jgi:alpha-L-fucosidase
VTARPSARQLAWQECELGIFLHFGVNTFTDREWGEGTEDPGVFNPEKLDTRQWAQVAKDAGFKYAIMTAKHHDGFCLWPSKYTNHSVKNSPWCGGKGDVVHEFADACHETGLKMGLYLSPWDRNCPSYGDSPAYNRHFMNQLTELLTNYGEVFEVWFDGACGEGPNGKKQVYDWQSYFALIRRRQPKAVIAICGPDVRWVGNEDGFAHETEWSVQPPSPTFHRGARSNVWWPSETDVSIRPGWFWHASQDSEVKSLDHLVKIYYESVGRNSALLLNVPPNKLGLIADPDVKRLREWRAVLDQTFKVDLAQGKPVSADSAKRGTHAASTADRNPNTYWSPAGDAKTGSLEIDLGKPTAFNVSMAQEHIATGQFVEEYTVEAWVDGKWREVAKGTTIGHKKLDCFPTVTATKARLTILKSKACPMIRRFGLFEAPKIA